MTAVKTAKSAKSYETEPGTLPNCILALPLQLWDFSRDGSKRAEGQGTGEERKANLQSNTTAL